MRFGFSSIPADMAILSQIGDVHVTPLVHSLVLPLLSDAYKGKQNNIKEWSNGTFGSTQSLTHSLSVSRTCLNIAPLSVSLRLSGNRSICPAIAKKLNVCPNTIGVYSLM